MFGLCSRLKPLSSQSRAAPATGAEAYFGRRNFGGWQNKAILVAAISAGGKRTFFWSPLPRRMAKERSFGARYFSGP